MQKLGTGTVLCEGGGGKGATMSTGQHTVRFKRNSRQMAICPTYQRPCWPPGSLSTCMTPHPTPYPKLLQLLGFPPPTSHSCVTLPFRPRTLLAGPLLSSSLGPFSLGCLFLLLSCFRPPPPMTQVPSAGHVQATTFSPCSELFQKPLVVLFLI